jgi:hypothetical protein
VTTKLHEVLAAEKTPNAAWNQVREGTMKKFHNTSHYYDGHSKSLAMIEDTPANKNIEDQCREEKPVTTTVFQTLDYALDIYRKAEDLQYQKNSANQQAVGTVLWNGEPFLVDMPVDQLLGLEARLTKMRELFTHIPTLDATKHWELDPDIGDHIWALKHPEETTKTEKKHVPIEASPATKEHPAQVHLATKDEVVGKFTTIKRSGAATALQKAEAIKRIDDLIVEIKQARMRANETEVGKGTIADKVVGLLLEPLRG